MNPSSTVKNAEQVLEKLFSKQIQENVERCSLLEKKIGVNVHRCDNIVKRFSENCGLYNSTDGKENENTTACAQFCDELFRCNRIFGVTHSHVENSIADFCGNTASSSLFASSLNEGKGTTKSELSRLASAKRLSESLTIQLESEEARLKAEIEFLTRRLGDSFPIESESPCHRQDINVLEKECDRLKEHCLKSIKDLSCSDHLETSRVKFERRKARQVAYLNSQEKRIHDAQLAVTKLEIFRDIIALEESALLEMIHCIDKIYQALRRYFEISTDIKSRFRESGRLLEDENTPSVIDKELREILISILKDPSENIDTSEMISNEILLKKLEDKMTSLETKNATALSTMREFGRVAHEISLMLGKALQWLECPDGPEAQQHNEAMESPCIYWNALGSFSGVIPNRLVERLLQVRRELDDASASLRKLELTFDLNSEVL